MHVVQLFVCFYLFLNFFFLIFRGYRIHLFIYYRTRFSFYFLLCFSSFSAKQNPLFIPHFLKFIFCVFSNRIFQFKKKIEIQKYNYEAEFLWNIFIFVFSFNWQLTLDRCRQNNWIDQAIDELNVFSWTILVLSMITGKIEKFNNFNFSL